MTTALCCLMLAAAPLALAQNIEANRKKLESPYKNQAEADRHKADTRALANCVAQARAQKINQRSPEWVKYFVDCQREKR
jgi:hypothetical protein